MFVNLTPHKINIHTDSETVVVSPSGQVARVETKSERIGEIDGIEIFSTTYGDVIDLPDPSEGVNYIVSGMVAQQVPWRVDVYSPGDLIRNEQGQPVGCRGLKRTVNDDLSKSEKEEINKALNHFAQASYAAGYTDGYITNREKRTLEIGYGELKNRMRINAARLINKEFDK